jgi:hypothetical protein
MTLKENAITVAIAILFTVFILVSIDAFYPRPDYNDFCSERPMIPKIPSNREDCTYERSVLEEECYQEDGQPRYIYTSGCQEYSECDYCSKEFRDAQKEYSNLIFLIIAPLGALAIIFGVYFLIEFLGTGFMFSGIMLMFYGTIQNFGELNRFTRAGVVLVELLLVLFIAYKKVIPDNKKKSKKVIKRKKN